MKSYGLQYLSLDIHISHHDGQLLRNYQFVDFAEIHKFRITDIVYCDFVIDSSSNKH